MPRFQFVLLSLLLLVAPQIVHAADLVGTCDVDQLSSIAKRRHHVGEAGIPEIKTSADVGKADAKLDALARSSVAAETAMSRTGLSPELEGELTRFLGEAHSDAEKAHEVVDVHPAPNVPVIRAVQLPPAHPSISSFSANEKPIYANGLVEKKIGNLGVFADAFDPPREGQRQTILQSLAKGKLDEVYVYVKLSADGGALSYNDRRKMAEAAFSGNPQVKFLAPSEFPGKSYAEVVEALAAKNRGGLVTSVTTADAIVDSRFGNLKGANIRYFVAGSAEDNAMLGEALHARFGSRPYLVQQIETVDTTGAGLRRELAEGRIPPAIPEPVAKYIEEKGLYGLAEKSGREVASAKDAGKLDRTVDFRVAAATEKPEAKLGLTKVQESVDPLEKPNITRRPAAVEKSESKISESRVSHELSFPSNSLRTPITYGLEVEYDVAKNPAILEKYRPTKVSQAEWEKLSHEQRVAYVQGMLGNSKWEKTLIHTFRKPMLERMAGAPSWLPKEISLEAHGTAEVSGIVVKTQAELDRTSAHLESELGKGFYQSHVVFPAEGQANLAGFELFDADRGQIKILSMGYEKHLADPNFLPAANMSHYALGPLSEASRKSVIHAAERIENGGKAGSGGAQRLVYGPALRDDVYPKGLVGYELRQYSTSRKSLIAGTTELSQIVENGRLREFSSYTSVGMIDRSLAAKVVDGSRGISQRGVTKFFSSLDKEMRRQTDFSVVGGASFGDRFLYPLRDWENNPVVSLSHDPISTRHRIEAATNTYLDSVRSLMERKAAPAEAIKSLRVAIGRWAKEADLEPLFDLYAAPKEKVFPPWSEPFRAERGPFVDKDLDPSRASVRILTKEERKALGLPHDEKTIAFYNLKQDGHWAVSLNPDDISGAKLVTQSFELEGRPAYHTMIRIDFKPGSPAAQLYEQARDGLGAKTRTAALYLSINFQQEVGQESKRLGLFEKSTAIAYQVFSLESETKFMATASGKVKLDYLPLKLTPQEAAEFLKIYLENGHARGGNEYYDLTYRGCAANCYRIMTEVVGKEKGAPQMMEWLLRGLSFNAELTPTIYRLNRWADLDAKMATEVGREASLSSISGAVSGTSTLPFTFSRNQTNFDVKALANVESRNPAAAAAARYFEAGTAELADARHRYLSGQESLAELDRTNDTVGHLETPVIGEDEGARRIGYLRQEKNYLMRETERAEAEQDTLKTQELKGQQAAVSAQLAAETQSRSAQVAASESFATEARHSVVASLTSDDSFRRYQEYFPGRNFQQVTQDPRSPEAKLLSELVARDSAMSRESESGLKENISSALWEKVAVEGEDRQARSEKMAQDLIESLGASSSSKSPDELERELRAALPARGWSSAEVNRCMEKEICVQRFHPSDDAKPRDLSSLARAVLMKDEMRNVDTDALAEAKSLAATPIHSLVAAKSFDGVIHDLTEQRRALASEARSLADVAGPDRVLAAKATQAEIAEKSLGQDIDVLQSNAGMLHEARPLTAKEMELDNKAASAVVDFLETPEGREVIDRFGALKAKDLAIDKAMSGEERLVAYSKFKQAIGELEPRERADVFDAFKGHVRQRPSEPAPGLMSEIDRGRLASVLEKADSVAVASGGETSFTRALYRESLSPWDQSLANAMGLSKATTPSGLERKAIALSELKQLESEAKSSFDAEKIGHLAEERAPASMASPGESVVSLAARELADLKALNVKSKAELIESVAVLERQTKDAKESLTRIHEMAKGDPDIFETYRMVYVGAADAMKIDKELSKEEAWERGIKAMLSQSGYSDMEINGGLSKKMAVCLRM